MSPEGASRRGSGELQGWTGIHAMWPRERASRVKIARRRSPLGNPFRLPCL